MNRPSSPRHDVANRPPAATGDAEQDARQYVEPTGQERSIAWLMSAVVHLAAVLAIGLMWHQAPRGAPVEPERMAGIVLVESTPTRTDYFSGESTTGAATESAASSAASASAASAADPLPPLDAPPIDLAGALPTPAGQPGLSGGDGLPSATGLVEGAGKNNKNTGGGKAQTYVFGVQGAGNKFLYVFDRSASMEGFQGRPLAAAKRELLASVQSLDTIHQFQIIFYNERTSVFNPLAPQAPRMMFADDKNKRFAENYVRGIGAEGGTHHVDALRLAIGMAPDVIFFLTDADEPQLTSGELADIARRNQRAGAAIHAIQFGAGPDPGGENFLKRLARMNNGQHTYVDVTGLPRNQ